MTLLLKTNRAYGSVIITSLVPLKAQHPKSAYTTRVAAQTRAHLAFTIPLSTTNFMFGSVIEVSATLVLTMTFRWPGGVSLNTSICCWTGRLAYRGTTFSRGQPGRS